MSFFSRLFDKSKSASEQQPAAPSSAGSSSTFKPAKAPGVLKIPRAARIQVTALHGLRCTVQLAGAEQTVGVANLSASGIGLITHTGQSWPAPGSTLQGALEFPGSSAGRVPFTTKVVHQTSQIVGARFEGESHVIREEIQRYFKVELGALRMSKVAPDMLRKDEEGEPNWSYGDNGCEIFYLTRGGRIVRFNLAFFGNYAEGGEGRKTRFGQIVSGDTSEKLQYKGNEEIRWDTTAPADLMDNAVRFVESVSHLGPEERAAIIALLHA